MRHTTLLITVVLLLTGSLFGCARPQAIREPATIIAIPEIAAEPELPCEPTLLEKYQEATKQLDLARVRAIGLEKELAEERVARKVAEKEREELRAQTASLEEQAAELAPLRQKYDEMQDVAFSLEKEVRNLRSELLEARLAGAKTEQALLAMKIEKAVEKRHRALQPIQEGADSHAGETGLETDFVTP